MVPKVVCGRLLRRYCEEDLSEAERTQLAGLVKQHAPWLEPMLQFALSRQPDQSCPPGLRPFLRELSCAAPITGSYLIPDAAIGWGAELSQLETWAAACKGELSNDMRRDMGARLPLVSRLLHWYDWEAVRAPLQPVLTQLAIRAKRAFSGSARNTEPAAEALDDWLYAPMFTANNRLKKYAADKERAAPHGCNKYAGSMAGLTEGTYVAGRAGA